MVAPKRNTSVKTGKKKAIKNAAWIREGGGREGKDKRESGSFL